MLQEADGRKKSKVRDVGSYVSRPGILSCISGHPKWMGGMSDAEHSKAVGGPHPLDSFSLHSALFICCTVASLFKTDLQIHKY